MSYSKTVLFLKKNTRLFYSVYPSGDYDKEIFQKYGRVLDETLSEGGNNIEIVLLEDQFITFNPASSRDKFGRLKFCECISPALSNEKFKSINNACQSISAVFSKERASKGNKVYNYVFFQDSDGNWKLIQELRNQIYKQYSADFARVEAKEGIGVGSYLRLHPDSIEYFAVLLKDKDSVIYDLQINLLSLGEQLNYYNNLFQKLKISVYENSLRELEERIKEDIPETKGSGSWQAWIYENSWLFGSQYVRLISKEKVGFDMIPDFLLLTADGFLDILEIKRPTTSVLVDDNSHTSNYRWSANASEAIGQADQYINEINSRHLEIAQRIKDRYKLEINAIKPRALILIGNSEGWGNKKRERFRSLNQMHHGVEVITYSDLFLRGKNIIKLYTDV